MNRKYETGFSLLELLVVVVIVGVLASIALLGYVRASRLMRDSVTSTRLLQVAEAEAQFRTALGRRRYATLAELAATVTPQGALVPATVLNLDSNGVSQPIDNWVLEQVPGAPTDTTYLRYKFDLQIRPAQAAAPDQIYCIHEDAVERQGTFGAGCTRTSPPVQR